MLLILFCRENQNKEVIEGLIIKLDFKGLNLDEAMQYAISLLKIMIN